MNTTPRDLPLDTILLRKAAHFYRAINHPMRQRLLQLIHQKGEPSVTSLYKELELDQPTCSQHLAILRKAELVVTRRQGHHIYYEVDYTQLQKLVALSRELVQE